jgi:hypothetical protein
MTGEPHRDVDQPSRGRHPAVMAVLAGVIALVAMVPVLRLWDADARVPFTYEDVQGDQRLRVYPVDVTPVAVDEILHPT